MKLARWLLPSICIVGRADYIDDLDDERSSSVTAYAESGCWFTLAAIASLREISEACMLSSEITY